MPLHRVANVGIVVSVVAKRQRLYLCLRQRSGISRARVPPLSVPHRVSRIRRARPRPEPIQRHLRSAPTSAGSCGSSPNFLKAPGFVPCSKNLGEASQASMLDPAVAPAAAFPYTASVMSKASSISVSRRDPSERLPRSHPVAHQTAPAPGPPDAAPDRIVDRSPILGASFHVFSRGIGSEAVKVRGQRSPAAPPPPARSGNFFTVLKVSVPTTIVKRNRQHESMGASPALPNSRRFLAG